MDTLRRGDTLYYVSYFDSGEISTLTTRLIKDVRIGHAQAFDRSGELIYEQSIRRVAGAASVRFTYYKDGAVKTAHFTAHPDGGIQRTDIKTSFDRDGNVTGTVDMSDDGFGRNPFVRTQPSVTKSPVEELKQETGECAVLYVTDVFAINESKKKMVFRETQHEESQLIEPGDTLKITTYVGAQVFDPPQDRVVLNATLEKPKRKWRVAECWGDPIHESKEKRRVYVHLRRVKK